MSLPSRRPYPVDRTARSRWFHRARGVVSAVVAVASAVVCVRAVPHWAGLVVCGAGLVLLAATAAERFARRRVGRPRVRQAPLPAGRPTEQPQTGADRKLSHQAAPVGRVPSPRRADSPRPAVRAPAVTGRR